MSKQKNPVVTSWVMIATGRPIGKELSASLALCACYAVDNKSRSTKGGKNVDAMPELIRVIEKIGQAKGELEKMKSDHTDACTVTNDPESLAPCSCGASARNSDIDRIIAILKIE